MENKKKRAIEELEKGRDFAKQLRLVINGGDQGSTEKLVKKVLMSFTNSLLILSNQTTCSWNQEVYDHHAPNSSCAKSEDSQESNCKTSPTTKERRGCYKRRRTSQSWEKESETPIEDGHQWRKYGQKVILNAKHPRNYYRCTHKYDQGCQATKQVQRIEDDPPLFKTIYYGHHTCRNIQGPEIILHPNSPCNSSSVFLSFDNTFPKNQECPFLTSSMVKEEEVPNVSSSSNGDDYLMSSHLTFDDTNKHLQHHHHVTTTDTTLSSNLDSDDVISRVLYDPSAFEPFLF